MVHEKEQERPDLGETDLNETQRLATVRALGLPARARDNGVLQAICETAQDLFQTETMVITVTGSDFVYFVAKCGSPVVKAEALERRYSLSSWIFADLRYQVFVAEDIAQDPRFEHLPWVKENGFAYYASAPLVASNGHCLGLLTAGGTKPSKRTAEDYNILCSFAELAAREMESGCYSRLEGLLGKGQPMVREPQDVEEAVFMCEVKSRWWTIGFANKWARKLSPLLQIPEPHFWGIFQPVDGAKNLAQKLAHAEIEQGNDFTLKVKLRERSRGEKEPLTICFRSVRGCPLSTTGTAIGIPNEVAATDQLATTIKHTHYFAVVTVLPEKAEQKLLGSPQTFLSREFRANSGSVRGGAANATGMSDIKLGVICSSSPTAHIYRALWNKELVSVKVTAVPWDQCIQSKDYGAAMIPKEAALSAELIHPNVIRTFKIVVQPKIADVNSVLYKKGDEIVEAWIVREWCGSGDLQAIVQRGMLKQPGCAVNLPLLLAIAADIAAGMEYLHVHSIIHGRLQPASILMGSDTHPKHPELKEYAAKIGSFSRAEVSTKPVHTTIGPADIPYAAPETISKGVVSKASDVYAFGKLLCYMHTNGNLHTVAQEERSWWRGSTAVFLLPEEMPSALEALIKDCLASKPSNRPDFTAIMERLAQMMAEGVSDAEDAEEAADNVSNLSKSFTRRDTTNGRRKSREQARMSMDNLRNSFKAPLVSVLSKKESKKQPQDFAEVMATGAQQDNKKQASLDAARGASTIFGKKIKDLISVRGRAVW